ncbi:MAG: hypothetical protein M3Q60_21015 [Actinomycetota bacterium]|nr:hypothetical protein [Actinomycetota bacterium]
MSIVRIAYLGILVSAMAWAMLSAVLLVAVLHEDDRGAAWFWAACFAVASLIADLSFWGVL